LLLLSFKLFFLLLFFQMLLLKQAPGGDTLDHLFEHLLLLEEWLVDPSLELLKPSLGLLDPANVRHRRGVL
jgi:hypothetical protein